MHAVCFIDIDCITYPPRLIKWPCIVCGLDFQTALEGRAIVNVQVGNMFAALRDISMSVDISPTAELLTNRGVINQFMNKPANAMSDYQQALRIDPSFALAYFNAANIYFHCRHFQQVSSRHSDVLVNDFSKHHISVAGLAVRPTLLIMST